MNAAPSAMLRDASLLLALAALAAFTALSAPRPAGAQSLRLLSPNGGEAWRIGSVQPLRWESDGTGRVGLYYHVGPFEPWIAIDEDTEDDGAYDWTVPDAPTETARVLISEPDPELIDTGDFDFFILPERGAHAELGLSARPNAFESTVRAEPRLPFDVWIVADPGFDPGFETDGVGYWEVSLEIPPEVLLIDRELFPEAAFDAGPGDRNFAVRLNGCALSRPGPVTLARLQLLLPADVTDARIELGPATPSFFLPAAAGWLSCVLPRERLPFTATRGLTINPALPPSLRIARVLGNPSAATTRLELLLPRDSALRVRIFDGKGRQVRSLERGTQSAGSVELEWDGRDDGGESVASGAYTLEITAAGETVRTRVVRLR